MVQQCILTMKWSWSPNLPIPVPGSCCVSLGRVRCWRSFGMTTFLWFVFHKSGPPFSRAFGVEQCLLFVACPIAPTFRICVSLHRKWNRTNHFRRRESMERPSSLPCMIASSFSQRKRFWTPKMHGVGTCDVDLTPTIFLMGSISAY